MVNVPRRTPRWLMTSANSSISDGSSARTVMRFSTAVLAVWDVSSFMALFRCGYGCRVRRHQRRGFTQPRHEIAVDQHAAAQHRAALPRLDFEAELAV